MQQGMQIGANFCTAWLLLYHTLIGLISKTYQNFRWLYIYLSIKGRCHAIWQLYKKL